MRITAGILFSLLLVGCGGEGGVAGPAAGATNAVAPTVPDPGTRVMAINVLGGCDKAAAEKALGPLTKDKHPVVAEQAKTSLAELKKAK